MGEEKEVQFVRPLLSRRRHSLVLTGVVVLAVD